VVKLFFLCRRRPDVTHDRYAELLLRGHVPIALRHHPTLRRYVVNLVEASPPGGPDLDSIGELSFATLDDYSERLYDSADGAARVQRDVAGFLGGADAYATTAHVQVARPGRPTLGARSPGTKLLCPIHRREGMTHEAFVAHWLGTHVPLARAHHPGLVHYVTNVVDARLSSTGEDWDGIAELHFGGTTPTAARFDSPEGERIVRDDMALFIARAAPYWVAEYPQRLSDD
jgi:uncharacterized protein (TIGR02118 family)